MPRPSAIVTEAELSVLEFLWEHGSSAVRDISKNIYEQNTAAYHATVNSLLDQLESKDFVKRDRSGFAHVFTAKIDRSSLVGKQLQVIANSHFNGALSPILLTLVDNITLKASERKAIRKIIESIK